MMRRLPALLMLATLMLAGCTKKLQNDSPKRESTGEGASASDGYKDENKKTPAAPTKTPEQGTATNTGDNKGNNQPDTSTSTPDTAKPGKDAAKGHSNETVPPKR